MVVFVLQPTQASWRIVFFIAAAIYVFCCTFYNIFASGQRQAWDNPANDESNALKKRNKKAGVEADPEDGQTNGNAQNGHTISNGNTNITESRH